MVEKVAEKGRQLSSLGMGCSVAPLVGSSRDTQINLIFNSDLFCQMIAIERVEIILYPRAICVACPCILQNSWLYNFNFPFFFFVKK